MKNYIDDDGHHLHDKTAKMVLKNKDAFVELVTVFLPQLAQKIDLEGLTLDTTNYLGSNFDEQFSDVAYRTIYKDDAQRAFALMFLTEHKRKINSAVAVQLLSYICEILKDDLSEKRSFTTVVVILLDQGAHKKRRKLRLIDYFDDLPKELRKYVPNFEIELITIKGLPDEAILSLRKDGILRGLLLMFKHLGDDDFLKQNFPEFFTFVKQNEHLFEFAKLYYEYLSRHSQLEPEEFHQLADTYFESQSKTDVMTTYDKIIFKAKVEGEVEERKTIMRRALLRGRSAAEIADFMELPLAEIEKLIDEIVVEDAKKQATDNARAASEVIENKDINNGLSHNA